jgi:hypothetical protein
MARLSQGISRYTKWVTLSHAPESVADAAFTPLSPSGSWCSIAPSLTAGARVTEHVVELRYHPQITIDTRIVYEDPSKPAGKTTRTLFVRGVQDPNEINDILRLLCEEILP